MLPHERPDNEPQKAPRPTQHEHKADAPAVRQSVMAFAKQFYDENEALMIRLQHL